jgi:hypothetical protein
MLINVQICVYTGKGNIVNSKVAAWHPIQVQVLFITHDTESSSNSLAYGKITQMVHNITVVSCYRQGCSFQFQSIKYHHQINFTASQQ